MSKTVGNVTSQASHKNLFRQGSGGYKEPTTVQPQGMVIDVYKFHIKHLPRKLNATPACMSRHPTTPTKDRATNKDAAQIINSAIKASFNSTYEQDPKLRGITWDRTVAAAAMNKECLSLTECIQKGFPKSLHELPEIIR